MLSKATISTLVFLLLFQIPFQAVQIDVPYIQELVRQGNYKKAFGLLKNNDISHNPDLRFYQALLYSWNDKYDISINILNTLISEYLDRLDFYTHLGRVYGWKGDYQKAVEVIKKAQE